MEVPELIGTKILRCKVEFQFLQLIQHQSCRARATTERARIKPTTAAAAITPSIVPGHLKNLFLNQANIFLNPGRIKNSRTRYG